MSRNTDEPDLYVRRRTEMCATRERCLLTLLFLAGTVASHEVHEIAESSCGILPHEETHNTKDIVGFASEFLSDEPTFCSGSPRFVTHLTMAPANFCTATALRDGRFDQFLLEAEIMRRWHNSSREFSEKVVLAPSIFFECSLNQSAEKDVFGKPKWRNNAKLAHLKKLLPPHLRSNLNPMNVYRTYWTKLRLSLAPRDGREVLTNPYVYPWTVVILGFSNDELDEELMGTLLEQPSFFVSRVIIGSLEGSHMLLRPQRKYLQVPVSRRPKFVSLPYPVGIESAVRFTEPSGAYRPSSRRPIAILLYWEHVKDGLSLGERASVRSNLTMAYDRLPAASSAIRLNGTENARRYNLLASLATKRGKMPSRRRMQAQIPWGESRSIMAVVCEPGGGGGGTGGGDVGCHTAAGLVAPATIYDATVSSDFCLEPIGDTPTRSHFYLAVLSGCIPVIFDDARGSVTTRGHWAAGGLDGTHGTRWAWRGTAGFALDYRSFAVVYETEEVEHDLQRVLEELAQMPAREPGRFEVRGVEMTWNIRISPLNQ